ncbi:MAG: hypothetical protein IJ259_06360 [Oscillospiraceae bacterium]|nr:hypothetical protein [Oscillospiraceae bacterium]
MKRKIKIILTCALCLILAAGMLAGCGSKDTAKGGEEVTLNYVAHGPLTMTVFTSDPAVDYTGLINQCIGTCETLFVLDDTTKEVKPLLATEIKSVDDTTWEITIRDGVKFSNGKALNAEAVKSALEYILSVNTRLGTMANVASMEADGQTLTVHTNDVVAILPRILTEMNMLIFDTDDDDYTDGLIGTGPYILEKMDADGNCDLVRNDDYWQGKPGAARVHTVAIQDEAARAKALQSGEIDWAQVSNTDLQLFENDENYEVRTRNDGRVFYLYLNPNYTFTQDDALREALQYAVDREAIVAGVYSGHGEATRSIFPSWSEFYTDEYLQPEYNVETARKILADAGYTDSDGDGFLEKDGEKVVLNITCYSANSFPTLSEVLQSMFKEIGIDSTIKISDKIFDDLTEGSFNVATYGYNTLTLGDSFNYMQPVFETDAGSNFTHFSDAGVDAALAEMKVTADPDRRAELVRQMQEAIYASNERLYIMHIVNNQVNVKGVQNLPTLFGSDNTNNSVLWQITK